jgi:hypothetical protein
MLNDHVYLVAIPHLHKFRNLAQTLDIGEHLKSVLDMIGVTA